MGLETKPRILVVDDDQDVADTLAMILNFSGFQATTAYSGELAVESALATPFDHLVSEVVLPGMSGFDAAIEICRRLPKCRVLFMSGNNGTMELLAAAQARGYDFDVLAKPFDPSLILATLRASGSAAPSA